MEILCEKNIKVSILDAGSHLLRLSVRQGLHLPISKSVEWIVNQMRIHTHWAWINLVLLLTREGRQCRCSYYFRLW